MCVERENPLYIYNRHSKLAAISPPAQGGGLGTLSLIFRRFPCPGVGTRGEKKRRREALRDWYLLKGRPRSHSMPSAASLL